MCKFVIEIKTKEIMKTYKSKYYYKKSTESRSGFVCLNGGTGM